MTTKRRLSLLPLFTLAGVMACSLNSGTPQGGNTGGTTTAGGTQGPGGGTTAVGGSIATGGVSSPGGATDTGGISSPAGSMDTGGVADTGGVSSPAGSKDTGGAADTGGVSSPAGATDTGGSTPSGGTSVAGGKTSTGGAAGGKGGSLAPGGTSGSAGKTASGGTTGSTGGTTGAAGAAGAAGAPPPSTGIPAGYPAPTADNYAKCQKVAIGTNDACGGQPSGNICIECLFGGTDYNPSETTPTAAATSAAGNYVVTVQLGGAAAGDTYVSAESTRGMLKSVATTAGQSLEYAFVVNVRAMEGQPKHAGGPGGYPGLDLFFSGKNPEVTAIGYALATTATKPIMVYVAGDSTTCDQTGGAFGGWAQMLPEYFGPPIGIANYANSGAASGNRRLDHHPVWTQRQDRLRRDGRGEPHAPCDSCTRRRCPPDYGVSSRSPPGYSGTRSVQPSCCRSQGGRNCQQRAIHRSHRPLDCLLQRFWYDPDTSAASVPCGRERRNAHQLAGWRDAGWSCRQSHQGPEYRTRPVLEAVVRRSSPTRSSARMRCFQMWRHARRTSLSQGGCDFNPSKNCFNPTLQNLGLRIRSV